MHVLSSHTKTRDPELPNSFLMHNLCPLFRVLFSLHMSKTDPSSMVFKEAFNAAAQTGGGLGDVLAAAPTGRVSAWPMIAFLSFIFATPYLIMKMVGRPDTSKMEQAKNPRTWSQPIPSQALHSFQAGSPGELSVVAGELVYVAPKEIQNQFRMMNTGWALATKDFTTSGMVPINYLQRHSQQQPPLMSRSGMMNNAEQLNRVFDSSAVPTAAQKETVEPVVGVAGEQSSGTIGEN